MSRKRKNKPHHSTNTSLTQENVSAQREKAAEASGQAEEGAVTESEPIKEINTDKAPEQAEEMEISAETGQNGIDTEKLQEQENDAGTEPVYSEDAYAEAAEHSEKKRTVRPKKKETKTQEKPRKEQPQEEEQDGNGEGGQREQSRPGIHSVLLRKMIFCVSLGVFSYALAALLFLMWGYYSSQKEYEELNQGTVVIGTPSDPGNQEQKPGNVIVDIPQNGQQEVRVPYLDIQVDERKLKALNQDYAFYIVIPGTNIQYPVVQGEDNNHYLRYTYSNQENTAGAIALDYRTDRSTYLQSFNTIISGHNRQDGTMFSNLASYKDERFRDAHPYIYIVMENREYVYEMFAFYPMEPVAVCYNPRTADDVYLNFVKEHNIYHNDIDVTLENNIITLYTCNEDSSMRYLCHAVLRAVYELE